MNDLEQLEKAGARTHTRTDYLAIREKAASHPAQLVDREIAVLAFFGGEREAADARAARAAALRLPAPGASTAATASSRDVTGVVLSAIKQALGPIWTRSRELQATIAELERRIVELEARPTLRDAGVWQANREYRNGDVCTFQGAGWLCRSTHMSVGTHPSPDAFRLFVKSGERK
jgi:hypothetical protein